MRGPLILFTFLSSRRKPEGQLIHEIISDRVKLHAGYAIKCDRHLGSPNCKGQVFSDTGENLQVTAARRWVTAEPIRSRTRCLLKCNEGRLGFVFTVWLYFPSLSWHIIRESALSSIPLNSKRKHSLLFAPQVTAFESWNLNLLLNFVLTRPLLSLPSILISSIIFLLSLAQIRYPSSKAFCVSLCLLKLNSPDSHTMCSALLHVEAWALSLCGLINCMHSCMWETA